MHLCIKSRYGERQWNRNSLRPSYLQRSSYRLWLMQPSCRPLPTMKLGENRNFTYTVFDPAKVTAVALTYSLTITPKPVRGNSEVYRGPLTPHVWGIAEIPLSINDTPENFLKELQLDTKFITLHLLSGELRHKERAA